MLKIEVIYNYRKKSVEIWADGNECGDIDYLQNRDIPSWFEKYSNDKFCWKGLIGELEELLGYSVENMEFDFQGDNESRKIFIQCLNEKNISTAKPKAEQPQEVQKYQGLENGKLLEKTGKIEEAREQYKISADLGEMEACYHYGRLSDGTEAVNYYRLSAQSGYGEAQCSLATCYKTGKGVRKDENEALSLYQKASEQNIPEAQYHLAMYYMNGLLVSKNSEKAKKLLEESAKSGVVLAELQLGNCYFKGLGTTVNKEVAVSWWKRAAQQGNTKAKYFLALCYLKGIGVLEEKSLALVLLEESSELMESKGKLGEILLESSNPSQGISWLEQAMEQGDIASKMELMKCYYQGLGVTKDYSKVINLYNSAWESGLDDKKYAEYHFIMGECLENGYGILEDSDKAIYYYELAAKHNHVPSKIKLGELYKKASTKRSKDIEKSLKWYESASDDGDLEAMFSIGKMYETREISDKKYMNKAYEWYLRAGQQGHMESQAKLGLFFYKGWGGIKWGYKESAEWYEKAAKQGHAESQFKIAKYFYHGDGVPKDHSVAYDWYLKAAEQGHPKAQKEALWHKKKGVGTTKNHKEAQRMAEKWQYEDKVDYEHED